MKITKENILFFVGFIVLLIGGSLLAAYFDFDVTILGYLAFAYILIYAAVASFRSGYSKVKK